MLRSPHDAEDAAQEAIVRAYRAQSRCRTPEAPHAWVRAIARREALRLYTQRVPLAEHAPAAVAGSASEEADAVLDRLAAQNVLRRVPAPERGLLVRRYVLEQTSQEIARDLSLPAATVRVRLHRAAKRVRDQGNRPDS